MKQGLDKVHLLLGLFVRGRVLANQTEDVGAGVFFCIATSLISH